ncbi:hypothetical protein BO78DRAFT_144554 [Aspergillus sclerotiicarbonarius CBS 121057]|uniref:Uncharacterized protein n=1 Tax=Aspergillus sclerotiicarbonarius (strain CBS 121057 / IBT 28362) TaxID=1448318 RepID=A0A319E715_ASPSB|nr:hypothetical protein BO78DRAFT_144554 [Aspergillus sclerotiicarbonarius CBS 121057]
MTDGSGWLSLTPGADANEQPAQRPKAQRQASPARGSPSSLCARRRVSSTHRAHRMIKSRAMKDPPTVFRPAHPDSRRPNSIINGPFVGLVPAEGLNERFRTRRELLLFGCAPRPALFVPWLQRHFPACSPAHLPVLVFSSSIPTVDWVIFFLCSPGLIPDLRSWSP